MALPYTELELADLCEMNNNLVPVGRMATKLGRSKTSIRKKLDQLYDLGRTQPRLALKRNRRLDKEAAKTL